MTAEDRALIGAFFWDVDWTDLDARKHRRFIIERLLRLGRPEQIKWVLGAYAEVDIIDAVKSSRTIDRRTANYWSLHFGIPQESVLCLNRQLTMPCFG